MAFVLALTVTLATLALGQNVCKWYDASNDLTLDLTPVYGEKLDYTDPNTPQYDYVYTICENAIQCQTPGFPVVATSVAQYDFDGEYCYATGVYVESVNPTYVEESNGDTYWSFEYQGTDAWSCYANGLPRVQIINWFCDPNANEPVITSQVEEQPCNYQMNVSYSGVCTTVPADNCVYNDPGTNTTLNLTDYQGRTFRYNDNGDVFEYSPCTNSLSCQYTPNGMVNYQTFGGCYMAALFDYRISPIRSTDANGNNMYSFFYDNGVGTNNECTTGISTNINWHCDRSPINTPNMVAKRIGLNSCQFQVDMYSNDACVITIP